MPPPRKPPLGEFELIDALLSAFERAGGAVRGGPLRRGPGDDCAVLAPEPLELCVTTDALVEGVHFTRPHFSLEDIGHKALAVNLSDLASMGARPSWFLCALSLPNALTRAEVGRLARGMARLSRQHRCVLAGGNFTRSKDFAITITAAGTTPPGSALLRSGARAGDLLYVSGTLGEAARALHLTPRSRADRQRRPVPRVSLGLLARGFASAAIDISDGLLQDLSHLCLASKVGAQLDARALPLSRAVRAAGEAGLGWALRGGEDYELLLAVPARRAAAFERRCARAGEKVSRIGALFAGAGIQVESAPARLLLGRTGHDHFI